MKMNLGKTSMGSPVDDERRAQTFPSRPKVRGDESQ